MRGRVVVCGTASISRWDEWPTGPRVERHLLVKRARMGGFVIFDHMDRYGAALEQLRTWIAEGRLKWEEDILEGIETCPDAIAGLYRGENKGKRLIRDRKSTRLNLQSLMRISYAVFCLKKKKKNTHM